jgi:hypothetical protein
MRASRMRTLTDARLLSLLEPWGSLVGVSRGEVFSCHGHAQPVVERTAGRGRVAAPHLGRDDRLLTLSVGAQSEIRALRLIRVATAVAALRVQSHRTRWWAVSGMESGVTETVVTALVVGGTVGGYLGYQIGNWRAAHRAARATYRTQRGLR